MIRIPPGFVARFLALVAVLLLASPATAQTWNGLFGNSWTSALNWTGGVPTSGGTVIFGNISNSNNDVTLGGSTSAPLAEVRFTATSTSYTLNSGTLLFINNGLLQIANGAGSFAQTVNMNVAFNGSGTIQTAPAGATLNLTGFVSTTAGTLTFNGAGSTNVSGVISGGSLTKLGSGTLTLTRANTYTGTTTINAGTLQLGNGTSTGSVVGDITNNAALAFNPGAAGQTYGGVVSGIGRLTKLGANTLTLTGTNTYSGGTTISAGTLQLGNGTSTGSVAWNITNNAALAFNPAAAGLAYGGVISGTGSLTKLGANTLTLIGASTYTGPTTVSGGVLAVSSLANGGLPSGIGASSNAAGNLVLDGGTLRYMGTGADTQRLFTLTQNGGTIETSTAGGVSFQSSGALAFTGSGPRTLTVNTGGTNGVIFTPALGNADGNSPTSLVKTGSGLLALGGTNTFTGSASVQQGELTLESSASAGTNAAYTVSTGATLTVGGLSNSQTFRLGSLAGGGTVRTQPPNSSELTQTLEVGGDNTSTTFSGTLQNSGGSPISTLALTKLGTGTLTLTGTSTYTGPTVISGGVLEVSTLANGGSASSIGQSTSAAGNLVLDGGTLRYTGAIVSTDRLFTLTPNGGTIESSAAGMVTFQNSGAVAFSGNGARTLTLTGTTTFSHFGVALGNGSGGATGLVKTGAGTWILLGTNTFSGPADIQQGELLLSTEGSAGTNAAYTVAAGATLTFGGSTVNQTVSLGSLAGGGTVRTSQPQFNLTSTLQVGGDNTSTTFSGTLQNGFTSSHSHTLALTKLGTGTLTLTGANTHTGPTTISGGVLSFSNFPALGSASANATRLVLDGGTLRYTGTGVETQRLFTLTQNGGTIETSTAGGMSFQSNGAVAFTGSGPRTLTFNTAGTSGVNFNPSLGNADTSSPTSLVKTGSALLTLQGTNTFTGSASVQQGELRLLNSTSAGTNAAYTVATGASLTVGNFAANQTFRLGSLAGGGTVRAQLPSSSGLIQTLEVGGDNTSTTFSGTLQNSGTSGSIATLTLTKLGTGTLTLTGANTYTGPTVISGGVLAVSTLANGGLASGLGASSNAAANLVLDGGTLRYTGTGAETQRLFTLTPNGGTIETSTAGGVSFQSNGAVAFTGSGPRTLTFNTAGTSGVNFNPALGNADTSSPTSLVKIGSGLLSLQGTNTFTGSASVQQGELRLLNSMSAGTNAAYTVSTGATLTVGGPSSSQTVRLGSLAGGGTVRALSPNSSGLIQTLEVGGDNTSTTFSGTLLNSGIGGGGTATLALTKVGTGTLTLTGNSSSTGATVISSGTLRVNGSLAAGSAVTVNTGGTLGGTGTVNGSVTVANGGTLAPGASIGTLTVGSMTWSAGGSYQFEYNAATTTPVAGTDNDLFRGTSGSTLNLAGLSATTRFNLTLSGTGIGSGTMMTYRIAEFDTISGATAGDISSLFTVTGDFQSVPTVSLNLNPTGLDYISVSYVPTPEPASIGLLAAMGLAVWGIRRRVKRG